MEIKMEKYASMWKADTPVERQAEARDLWDGLTGIEHSKKDTTARLQELFPSAGTHNKEASKSSVIRDRLMGAMIASGAVGGGLYQKNRSKKNELGFSPREIERESDRAAYMKEVEMGKPVRSRLSNKSARMRERIEKYLDENPGQATALGAILGGTAAGVGAHSAFKNLSKRAV